MKAEVRDLGLKKVGDHCYKATKKAGNRTSNNNDFV